MIRSVLVATLVLLSGTLLALPHGKGVFSLELPGQPQPLTVYYYLPDSYAPSTPPVMVFHGMKRNADFYRDSWIDLAEANGFFVLTPLFTEEMFPGTTGYNLGNLFSTEAATTPPAAPERWSYAVPHAVFRHVKDVLQVTSAPGYMAFGHSAGSQFLHRLMALNRDPHLLLAIPSNAGWYTLPDSQVAWPYGYLGTGLSKERLRDMLQIRTVVLLGDADTRTDSSSLRRTPEAMAQGPHRFSRGQFFFHTVTALAKELEVPHLWDLQIVPGVGHDGDLMAPHAARIMRNWMAQDQASPLK